MAPQNETGARREPLKRESRPGQEAASPKHSTNASKIVADAGRRKRGSAARSVSRHRPSRDQIRAAMWFLDPRGSR
jgi:hypothetical protein